MNIAQLKDCLKSMIFLALSKAKKAKKQWSLGMIIDLICVYNQRNSLEVRNLLQLWPDNIQMCFSL